MYGVKLWTIYRSSISPGAYLVIQCLVCQKHKFRPLCLSACGSYLDYRDHRHCLTLLSGCVGITSLRPSSHLTCRTRPIEKAPLSSNYSNHTSFTKNSKSAPKTIGEPAGGANPVIPFLNRRSRPLSIPYPPIGSVHAILLTILFQCSSGVEESLQTRCLRRSPTALMLW